MSPLFCLFLLLAQAPSVNAHLKQGLVALNGGKLAEAEEELEQAQKDEPRNPFVWSSLAQTYLREGEFEKAESAGQKAEDTGGQNPVVAHALAIFYFEYAQALLHKEQFTHAADVLTGALKNDPQNAQLTLALGVARYGQRRFDDAIAAFLKVIQLDPATEQPYVFLGKMLDQAGTHLPEIVKDDRAWMEKSPNEARPPLELAKALLASDARNTEAHSLLQRSVKLDSNNWESHYELGVLLANRHEYRDAATELTRSIELNGKQPMPHYHLARVYDRLGEPERAKAEREIHAALTGTQQ